METAQVEIKPTRIQTAVAKAKSLGEKAAREALAFLTNTLTPAEIELLQAGSYE